MRTANLGAKVIFNLILIIFAFRPIFITPSTAEDFTEKSQSASPNQEARGGTRIEITTSGPAKFDSYWLDSPPRLVVKFQTRNIISKMDDEVIVNQGVIKRIQAEYFGEGQKRALKSLTFELLEKVPYKIWQEADTIILDIQTPQEISVFPEEGKEVFAKNETKEEKVETPSIEVSTGPLPSEAPKIIKEFPKVTRKTMIRIAIWLIGLVLVSGLGLLLEFFWRRYRSVLDKILGKSLLQEIARLKSELQEKDKLLERQKVISKVITETSLAKEKELEQLKLELEKAKESLEQEERARKTIEEEMSQKVRECEQLKSSLESLKETVVKKEFPEEKPEEEKISVEKLPVEKLPEEKAVEEKIPEEKVSVEEEKVVSGQLQERRQSPRLDLSLDYGRTITLRIEPQDKTKSIKSFANNISLDGLCFETRREFEENEVINLRLFFFGDRIPMMKIKAKIIWKRRVPPVNYYGVSFISLEDKDRIELKRYIESKIAKGG
jgi:hypothetical protein